MKQEIIDKTINIIFENKRFFNFLLNKKYETAGNINLLNKHIEITAKSSINMPYIENVPSYEISTNLIDWNTHPNSITGGIEEEFKKNKVLEAKAKKINFFPSHTDIVTNIMATMYYDNQVISVIIHNKYIVIYSTKLELAKFLNSKSKEEQQNIIENFIIHNIGDCMMKTANIEGTIDNKINFFIDYMNDIISPTGNLGVIVKCFDIETLNRKKITKQKKVNF